MYTLWSHFKDCTLLRLLTPTAGLNLLPFLRFCRRCTPRCCNCWAQLVLGKSTSCFSTLHFFHTHITLLCLCSGVLLSLSHIFHAHMPCSTLCYDVMCQLLLGVMPRLLRQHSTQSGGGTAKESFALCCILLFYADFCSQQSMPPCKKKTLAIALEDGEEQLGSSHWLTEAEAWKAAAWEWMRALWKQKAKDCEAACKKGDQERKRATRKRLITAIHSNRVKRVGVTRVCQVFFSPLLCGPFMEASSSCSRCCWLFVCCRWHACDVEVQYVRCRFYWRKEWLLEENGTQAFV